MRGTRAPRSRGALTHDAPGPRTTRDEPMRMQADHISSGSGRRNATQSTQAHGGGMASAR